MVVEHIFHEERAGEEIIVEVEEEKVESSKARSWHPLGMRILFAFFFGIALLWIALSVAFTLLSTLFWLGRGCKNTGMQRHMERYWHYACLAGACSVGSAVALISTQFGVSIICVYLLIHAHDRGDSRVIHFLRTRFQDAFGRFS